PPGSRLVRVAADSHPPAAAGASPSILCNSPRKEDSGKTRAGCRDSKSAYKACANSGRSGKEVSGSIGPGRTPGNCSRLARTGKLTKALVRSEHIVEDTGDSASPIATIPGSPRVPGTPEFPTSGMVGRPAAC